MENFKASGVHTKQAHVAVPDGTYEEEHGRNGFFGRVSHIYHEHPPVGWTKIEGNLKPRLLPPIFEDDRVENDMQPILYNNDVIISIFNLKKSEDFFRRNADFDELYFVHDGEGKVETIYGHLELKKGDYIIIPRGTTYQLFSKNPLKLLYVESSSEFEQPSRGILGPNALYDQTAIVSPEVAKGTYKSENKEYKIRIKREGEVTNVTYPYNPLDAKGWKGSLYPFKFSIYDYCPIMSHRYHIPPSGHTTFVCKNFVICSFVERPLEDTKHKVLKVPFYHSNIDYDEVLFYHQGNFFSRDNIDPGAITFHPQGIHHGPHPNAFAKADDKEYTDEYAVMIDTKYPLKRTSFFKETENKDYWKSWQ